MLLNDTDLSVRQERARELLREAEQERLVELVRLQQPVRQNMRLKLLGWIGGQLIQWGLKLQQDKLNPVRQFQELAENTD